MTLCDVLICRRCETYGGLSRFLFSALVFAFCSPHLSKHSANILHHLSLQNLTLSILLLSTAFNPVLIKKLPTLRKQFEEEAS
jgi:hypothetical protein